MYQIYELPVYLCSSNIQCLETINECFCSTGGNTPKIIQLIRQAQGLDPEEESILKKLTPHVPGVVTFADHNRRLPWTTEYRSVLVFADISGMVTHRNIVY